VTDFEPPAWRGVRSPVARRAFLRTAAAGATGGVAAWSLASCSAEQPNPGSSARPAAAGAATEGEAAAEQEAAATAAVPEPRNGPASVIIPLDAGWTFGPASRRGALAPVTLPHTVTPLSWQGWNPARWERRWLYAKTFDAPAESSGKRVFLDFAGAMTHSTVTLNDAAVADFLGGYLPFGGEITGYLQHSGNRLSVLLDSRFNQNVPPDRPKPWKTTSVDFWQPGGIYRGVRLRVVPQVFITDVFARPVKASDWSVDVQVTVDAGVVPAKAAKLKVELLDGTRVVSSATTGVSITQAGTQVTVSTTLTKLGDVSLWDITSTSPKLYTVVATLLEGSTPVHDYRVLTGFRTISFAEDGFYLNGRRVKLFGLNRHQLYPFAGGAMPARVQAKDAQILRQELNCNMVRCSHYPQSEDFLDACDRLGLMVWEEAPGWGYIGDAAWRDLTYRDVRTMIVRDRNHPSVICWGVRLNETRDEPAFYEKTNEIAETLDRSRPTVGAMNTRQLLNGNYQQDVYGFNDYSHVKRNGVRVPTLQPPADGAGKPYIISETIGTLSGPGRFYRRTDDQAIQQGQAMAHAIVHDIAASDDRYCGLLAWSGFDYPSGSGHNQYKGVKYTGVVDLFRVLKPGAAIYQAQVSPTVAAVIAPAFYWDFGKASPASGLKAAMICSNLDRLKVYVGGELLATVKPDRAGYRHLTYPPSFVDFSAVKGAALPELRIDGYLGSALVASRLLSADHAGDSLSLQADDKQIVGDGVDATRLVVRAVDRHGAPRPYVRGKVTFAIAGPHVLVGESPFDFTHTGAAGAIWIRSRPHSTGAVTVKASHRALGHAEVTINVVSHASPHNMLEAIHRRSGHDASRRHGEPG
jgi:beta-galactosidase